MNSDKLNNSISKESKFWRENMIREEIKNVNLNLDDLYAKFFKIVKNNRIIPERIEKLIVGFITR
jgi:hypothetical protein